MCVVILLVLSETTERDDANEQAREFMYSLILELGNCIQSSGRLHLEACMHATSVQGWSMSFHVNERTGEKPAHS